MFGNFFHKKYLYIAAGITCVLLATIFIYRLLPLSRKSIERSTVIVKQEAYYRLEVNGTPVLFFTDYKGTRLIGGATSKDSVKVRSVRVKGYWVNMLPILPSCRGRILTTWENKPSIILNLRSEALHQLMEREYKLLDDELAGLQTQRNELTYYMRTHSVQDFGYNRIADYQRYVTLQMDSLSRFINKLRAIDQKGRLRVRQINRYAIVRKRNKKSVVCRRINTDAHKSFILLQTYNKRTPIYVRSKMSAEQARSELEKSRIPEKTELNPPVEPHITDSSGYYVGPLLNGKPHGYGRHFGKNGSFYSGHWENGQRNGFGFYVAPHEYLMVGEWKDNVFKGERLTYHSERVYGIDISRHQHEKYDKVFNIDWNRLRIKDLGTLSTKKIKGKVDYPISFIYIKSTEGCTVFNKYYHEDYRKAREKRIHVGSYHFFSTTSAGAAQARFFLLKSRFLKGDLPAVLDVEPSDAQIRRMGGAEIMFKHIRDWLSVVHKATGVRPILYVSQMFTKKYLPLAIDIQGNYFVWIARYGEYKPDIKLKIWQLSPDGKVAGIHGDVDINVFNGYKNNYEEFLKKHTIQ